MRVVGRANNTDSTANLKAEAVPVTRATQAGAFGATVYLPLAKTTGQKPCENPATQP